MDFSGQSNTQGENRGFTETFGNRMNRGFAVSAQKDDFTMSSQGGDLLDHGRITWIGEVIMWGVLMIHQFIVAGVLAYQEGRDGEGKENRIR